VLHISCILSTRHVACLDFIVCGEMEAEVKVGMRKISMEKQLHSSSQPDGQLLCEMRISIANELFVKE